MTNEPRYHDVFDGVDPAAQALLNDLAAVHAFALPAIVLPAAAPAKPPRFMRRHLRPLALGAAAVAALAVFLAAPSFSGDGDGTVSAQTILERSQRAAATSAPASAAVRSYHMVAEQVIAGDVDAKKATIRTETWYQDNEHVRIEEISPSTGRVIFGQSRDGDDFWIYGIFDGHTAPASGEGTERAVHAPADEVSFGKVPVDTGGTSLADLLAQFSAKDCFTATLAGEGAALGRQTYIIEVRPLSGECKVSGRVNGKTSLTRLWVDEETFVTLRSDFYAGDVLHQRYEVLQFDLEPAFAADVFVYQPAPDVEVIEVGSLAEAKQALAGILQSDKPKDGAPQPKTDANVPAKPTP